MLLNDTGFDLKVLCHDLGITQTQFAENAGKLQPFISQLFCGRKNLVLQSLVEVLEKNGYDVRLEYVRREQKG